MKIKSNFMLRLASFLFVCVIVSTVTLAGLLARYVTSDGGSDSARVIKFNTVQITENNTNAGDQFIICPGVDIKKDVEVTFGGSEAATYVFLTIDASKNWKSFESGDNKYQHAYMLNEKECLTYEVDEQWSYHTSETNDDKKTFVYYMYLDPNDSISDFEVIKDEGTIKVSRYVTMDDLATMVSVSGSVKKSLVDLDFKAVAVQANGFEDVTEAWNSVKNK